MEKNLWTVGLTTLVIGNFWLEHCSGRYISVFILYLLPTILATWKLGLSAGIIYSVIVSLLGAVNNFFLEPDIHFLSLLTTTMFRMSALCTLVYFIWKTKILNETLIQSSLIDDLTGIKNRRAFFLEGQLELDCVIRAQKPISVVFLDLDNFKALNDSMGHKSGDNVLRKVATFIQSRLRKIDIFARIGGDEFAIILPFTDADGAKKLVYELHTSLQKGIVNKNIPIGFSIGIATFTQPPASLEYALNCADKIMYEIKKSTGNAVLQRNFLPKPLT